MTGLLVMTEADWNRPLSEISPIFATQDPISLLDETVGVPQWDKITPWSLATQLSGLPTVRLSYLDNLLSFPFASSRFFLVSGDCF